MSRCGACPGRQSRIAEGQHRLQTWADPLLGWTSIDGAPFYVRQLSDHKASIDPADLKRSSLLEYAQVCGETFAKAHGRTGDAVVLSGYAGQADKLDRAIGELAITGADQVTGDWELLVRAIARGQIEALALGWPRGAAAADAGSRPRVLGAWR